MRQAELHSQGRAAKSAVLREEMQGFLQQQREKQPPRNESCLQDLHSSTQPRAGMGTQLIHL